MAEQPTQVEAAEASEALQILEDDEATVRATDLYNLSSRIVIVTADVDDYWHRRRLVDDPAHNPRARAPEHVELVNNLSAMDHRTHDAKSNLTAVTDWDKLATHVQHVAAPLQRCCFQCGMLNHPTPGDTIKVTNVMRKRDCRAYRVFRYYIRQLVGDERERLESCADAGDEAELKAEAERNVFLCEPTRQGDAGARCMRARTASGRAGSARRRRQALLCAVLRGRARPLRRPHGQR